VIKDRLTALGLFGVSVLYLLGCLHLQVGTVRKPGAGFLPTLVGVALLVSSGLYVFQIFRRKPEERPEQPRDEPGSSPWTVSGLLVCTLLYPLVLKQLSFVAATFLVVWAMLLIMRYRSALFSLFLALLLSLCCFGVFALLLGVALPGGVVEQFLYGLRG
jgi:hypothetical protein